jgi:hypothetical protein
MISPQGRARRFASLPPGRFLSGIAFDATGRFGHRLLVTAGSGGRTTVFGIGCDGRLSTIVAGAPAVEGGITVAPATFGRYGGDLIAADESSGRVYAVDPAGQVIILARPVLPAGGDIGVESTGFVPQGAAAAYLADRFSAGNTPKAAPRPSTSAARPRAPSGTLPPDPRSRTPKGTLPSHRRNDATTTCPEIDCQLIRQSTLQPGWRPSVQWHLRKHRP